MYRGTVSVAIFEELKRRNVIRVGAAYVVMSWLVIQIAETIFPLFGFGDMPARVVVILAAIGFFPVLIFAWAYELTPEGIKLESEVERDKSITGHTGKRLDMITILTAVAAVGLFAYSQLLGKPAAGPAPALEATLAAPTAEGTVAASAEQARFLDRSIAVLPFVNMSSDPEQEYFSDGISEEVLNLLAQIPEMKVISRSSAFSFKDKDLELTEIAERLNVAHILEGSVRKGGDKVRITAQLIDMRTDTHLWSETWDRSLEDVFAVQDEIARDVARQLKIQILDGGPTSHVVNAEAYTLYLQAMRLIDLSSLQSLLDAQTQLERALELQPDYVEALLALSDAEFSLSIADTETPVKDRLERLESYVARAEQIDPEHPKVIAAKASMALNNGDWAEAARYVEKSMRVAPTDVETLRSAAALASALGRIEESIVLSRHLLDIDPVSSQGYYRMAYRYNYAQDFEKGIPLLRKALLLSPDAASARYQLGENFLFLGRFDEALDQFLLEEDPEYNVKGQALVAFARGDIENYERLLTELIEGWGKKWPSEVAHVLAYAGDKDGAFEWLDKAVAINEDGLFDQFQRPLLNNLRDDPRWLEFREKSKTSQSHLDSIAFEIDLAAYQ